MRRQLASVGIGAHLRSLLHVSSSFPFTYIIIVTMIMTMQSMESNTRVFLKPNLSFHLPRGENLLVDPTKPRRLELSRNSYVDTYVWMVFERYTGCMHSWDMFVAYHDPCFTILKLLLLIDDESNRLERKIEFAETSFSAVNISRIIVCFLVFIRFLNYNMYSNLKNRFVFY